MDSNIYIELWSDKKFIKKRIEEQKQYIWDKRKNGLSHLMTNRDYELIHIAREVMFRFIGRLEELNSGVA